MSRQDFDSDVAWEKSSRVKKGNNEAFVSQRLRKLDADLAVSTGQGVSWQSARLRFCELFFFLLDPTTRIKQYSNDDTLSH